MTSQEVANLKGEAVWVKIDGIVRLAIIKKIDKVNEQFYLSFIDGSMEWIHWRFVF